MGAGGRKFESCHPDIKPASSAGSVKNRLAHFGALGTENLDFVVENQNQILDQMIKSVTLKTFGMNVSKRWYVEYYEFNPITSSWLRKREYGFVNKEKDAEKRLQKINALCHEIIQSMGKKFVPATKGERSIKKYVNMYLADKNNTLKETSMANIKATLTYFIGFLADRGLADIQIHDITKDHIHDFKKYLSAELENRTVNNHMSFLKSFFNYFINNYEDLLVKNPVKGTSKLKTISETHVAYTDEEAKKIFEYLERHDQQLLLYCMFVGIGFVRCEESRNLRIRDIDFTGKKITLSADIHKPGTRVNKPMLKKFYSILKDRGLHKYPGDFYIFSMSGQPGTKMVYYNYFQKRFKKVKDEFGLSKKHTIYGFRHTSVSQMLERGAKWHEAMKYTGHTTMEAFSKYAKSLMNKPAEDLSEFITLPIK